MPDFSCPSGGTWHVCDAGSLFIGCCTQTDACTHGCSASNLYPTSFDAACLADLIPDPECGLMAPNGALFYICPETDPPFWGCCTTDPCNSGGGCPRGDLGAAYLQEGNFTAAKAYGAKLVSASASASSAFPAAAAAAASTTPLLRKRADNTSKGTKIFGIVVAVLVSCSVVVFAVLLYIRKFRHRPPPVPNSGSRDNNIELGNVSGRRISPHAARRRGTSANGQRDASNIAELPRATAAAMGAPQPVYHPANTAGDLTPSASPPGSPPFERAAMPQGHRSRSERMHETQGPESSRGQRREAALERRRRDRRAAVEWGAQIGFLEPGSGVPPREEQQQGITRERRHGAEQLEGSADPRRRGVVYGAEERRRGAVFEAGDGIAFTEQGVGLPTREEQHGSEGHRISLCDVPGSSAAPSSGNEFVIDRGNNDNDSGRDGQGDDYAGNQPGHRDSENDVNDGYDVSPLPVGADLNPNRRYSDVSPISSPLSSPMASLRRPGRARR